MNPNWQRKRVKFCFDLVNEKIDDGVSGGDYIGLENVESGTGRLIETVEPTNDDGVANRFAADSILFGKLRPYLAKVVAPDRPGCCTSELLVLRPKLLERRFAFYSMLDPEFIALVNSSTYGSKMPRANWDFIGNQLLNVPPIPEQRMIAGYLDRMTAQIDAVVAKKQRMIELLRDERQSLISRAVTRGLDAGVRLKGSGIPWLGDIPEHWSLAPLYSRYEVRLGKMLNASRIQGDSLAPYLRNVDVRWGMINTESLPQMDFSDDEREHFRLRAGDLLVCEGGVGIGRCAVWKGDVEDCYYQKALHRLRPTTPHDSPFFLQRVICHATFLGLFVVEGNASAIDHLPAEALRRKRFAFPPFSEQLAVVAYIDRETIRIDGLIEKNEQQVSKLREYRQTLISAVVTGTVTVPLEETPDFRAAVLAAEIIFSHPATEPIGRTKLHKTIYGAEHECDLVGIDSDYGRLAFGPYDDRLQKAVERELEARLWYKAVEVKGQKGKKIDYVPLAQAGQHRAYFDKFYGDKAEAIARLVAQLRPLNKDKIERAITLYAAWNDFLIRIESVDDGRLLTEVQNNWHPEKQHKEVSWRESLAWLKARKLIPHGFGKPTRPTDVLTGLTTAPEDDSDGADDNESQ